MGEMHQMLVKLYGEIQSRRDLVHIRVTRLCDEFKGCELACVISLCDVALPVMTYRASNLILSGLLVSLAL